MTYKQVLLIDAASGKIPRRATQLVDAVGEAVIFGDMIGAALRHRAPHPPGRRDFDER